VTLDHATSPEQPPCALNSLQEHSVCCLIPDVMEEICMIGGNRRTVALIALDDADAAKSDW